MNIIDFFHAVRYIIFQYSFFHAVSSSVRRILKRGKGGGGAGTCKKLFHPE